MSAAALFPREALLRTGGAHHDAVAPSPPAMKPKITGKKKKGSAAGASSGKGHAPGAGEKRLRETKPAADDDDMFMSVPSFENDGKEFNLGGAGPAWKTYDWQGETSAREKKRARDARAGSERADADAGRSKEKKKRSKEPVVNRVKPPRPEKKVKVDMRFGSEADKKKLADERFDERREAKRQKYAALSAAAAERDGDGANEVEPGISGKVLGRRRRAAEKRARAAEKRRADRLERGLPVTRPVKPLPAKLAVGTAAGVSALAKGGDDAGSKNKNAKRKERREKARTARDAEDAKAQVTPGLGFRVPGDATTATREKAEAAGKPNPDRSAKGAPEESAKARARREKREAAERSSAAPPRSARRRRRTRNQTRTRRRTARTKTPRPPRAAQGREGTGARRSAATRTTAISTRTKTRRWTPRSRNRTTTTTRRARRRRGRRTRGKKRTRMPSRRLVRAIP